MTSLDKLKVLVLFAHACIGRLVGSTRQQLLVTEAAHLVCALNNEVVDGSTIWDLASSYHEWKSAATELLNIGSVEFCLSDGYSRLCVDIILCRINLAPDSTEKAKRAWAKRRHMCIADIGAVHVGGGEELMADYLVEEETV